MRFAYLGSAESWYVGDLRRAAGARHRVDPVPFDGMHAGLGGADWPESATANEPLGAFDAILIRAMGPGSLEQVVFRMNVLGRYAGAGGVVVNPPRAVEAAVDKFLALAWLQDAGLLVPRTIVCQGVDDACRAFDVLGRDVVVKPIFGAEGRGIVRLSDPDLAERAFRSLVQLQSVLYIQEYIEHCGRDYRLLVVGNRVFGMLRENGADWRTNVSRGAVGKPLEVTSDLGGLALRSARAIGASLAGVDVVPARDGRLFVIEVNASPGWKGLAAATGIDAARCVLDHLEESVNDRRSPPD